MTRKLKVLIIDINQVFVAGIKLILQSHFHAKDIKLIFTSDKAEYSIADIILWATGYPATIAPICVLDRRFHDKLIIIGSTSKNHTVDHGTEKIYYRHQCGSRLIELTENVLKKTSINPDASLSLKYDPFSIITSRQKEVLSYVSIGMNPNE
ncbi:hypothetical protein, partial [Serratia sp. ASV30]|uniref:hypothetical protein n=1 Tax=Serratia sp. ASV30 TaxID=2795127 RepID=UPI0018EA3329